MITNDYDLSNFMNDYFVGISESEVNRNMHREDDYRRFLQNFNDNTMYVEKIEEHELLKILKNIKGGKGAGIDEIRPILIKENSELFLDPLLMIFNEIIEKEKIPEEMKLAKIVSVLKKGDR